MAADKAKNNQSFLLNKLEALNGLNEKLIKEKEDLQTELDNERSRSALNIKAQATIEELQDKVKNLELAKTTNLQKLENELREVKEEMTTKNVELDKTKADLGIKQNEVQRYQSQLEALQNQQHSELVQKGHMLESQETKFKDALAAKDSELFNLRAQLQQNAQLLSETIASKDRELSDLNGQLHAKNSEITHLMSKASNEKSHAQNYYGNQLLEKDNKIGTLSQNCNNLQQQIASSKEAIDQLKAELQQSSQRIRKAEEDKSSEVQRLLREISDLKRQYEDQLARKENELQKYAGDLEKQLATFKELQERFRNVVNEKKKKESELQKASKEFEEAVSMLETCQTQIQKVRDDKAILSQGIEQKDKEIEQLKKREQSTQDELKLRAEKIKALEKMINDLKQQTDGQQKQLQEFDAKCERLEGEVNRANSRMLHGRSRERTDSEISAASRQTPDQQSYHPRLGSGSEGQRSDPSNRSSGYNQVPLNQSQAEYHQQQPFNQQQQETPNRFGYNQGQPDRNRGYDPIPGRAVNQGQQYEGMRSPPAGNQQYQGGPLANQLSPQYQPLPMNQPAGRFQPPQPPLDQPYIPVGPLEASFNAELKSGPCPLCGKKFPTEDMLTTHAATCNYDPDNH